MPNICRFDGQVVTILRKVLKGLNRVCGKLRLGIPFAMVAGQCACETRTEGKRESETGFCLV